MRICPRCREEVSREDPKPPFAIAVLPHSPALSDWLDQKSLLGDGEHLPIYRLWMERLGAGPALVLWTYVSASHSVSGGSVVLTEAEIIKALYGLFTPKTIRVYKHSLLKAGLLQPMRVLSDNVKEIQVNWEGLADLFGGAR